MCGLAVATSDSYGSGASVVVVVDVLVVVVVVVVDVVVVGATVVVEVAGAVVCDDASVAFAGAHAAATRIRTIPMHLSLLRRNGTQRS